MGIQGIWRRYWKEHRTIVILVGLGLALVLTVVMVLVLSGGGEGAGDRVRRLSAQVWAGAGGSPPLLEDDGWHALSQGDRVFTDATGEAQVDLAGCLSIYLFQDGQQLVKSACPRSERGGGNVTCAFEGTSVYNNSCADQIIVETPSAEVVLQGTWVSVTYLPDRELSVILVSEGGVEVLPVLDAQQRTLGESVVVKAGYFMYTAPDSMLNAVGQIAGLAPRQAHPFESAPNLFYELSLDTAEVVPWVDGVREQAKLDGVPVPPGLVPVKPTPVTPEPTPRIQDEGPIRIGLQLPFGGEADADAEGMLAAVGLLVERTNEAGGWLGRPVELVVAGDADDPDQAQEAAWKLVENEVIAVVGGSGDSATQAAARVYVEAGLLYIASASSTPLLNRAGYPLLFRVSFSDRQYAQSAAVIVREAFEAQRVGLVQEDSAQGKLQAGYVEQSLAEAGIELLFREIVRPYELDAGPVMALIAEAQPDLIYFAGGTEVGGLLLRASVEYGLDQRWVFGPDGLTPALGDIARGYQMQNVYVISEPLPRDLANDGPAAYEFALEFERRRDAILWPKWARAAESLYVIGYAVEKTGSTDPEVLAGFLHEEARDLEGLTGSIAGWDERGDPLRANYALYRVNVQGQFELVWTENW